MKTFNVIVFWKDFTNAKKSTIMQSGMDFKDAEYCAIAYRKFYGNNNYSVRLTANPLHP